MRELERSLVSLVNARSVNTPYHMLKLYNIMQQNNYFEVQC